MLDSEVFVEGQLIFTTQQGMKGDIAMLKRAATRECLSNTILSSDFIVFFKSVGILRPHWATQT